MTRVAGPCSIFDTWALAISSFAFGRKILVGFAKHQKVTGGGEEGLIPAPCLATSSSEP